MALKILLVDPENSWLENADNYLRDELYDVAITNTGKCAQTMLFEDKYFSVVMNIETTNHSAVQVLKYIKSNIPNQKVIVTMEKDSLEKHDDLDLDKLRKMGATGFLVKPFDNEDLKDALEGDQSVTDLLDNAVKRGKREDGDKDEGLEDDDLAKISIDEFFGFKALLFDVYIKLSENKYVKILHSGDTFSQDRIDHYKNEKKLTHLYFKTKDRMKYIKFNNYVAANIVKSDKIPAKQKAKMLNATTDKLIELAFSDGVKPQVIDQGREVCKAVLTMIDSHKDLFELLRDFQNFYPESYSHSYLVTMYTGALVKQLDWQSDSMVEMMALASMFHDIGKMKLNELTLRLHPEEMNKQHREEYEKHPQYGVEILDGNQLINNNIKQIIMQHHEAFDGSGFPKKLKGSKLMVMANAIKLVDDFVHIIRRDEIKPLEALRYIIADPKEVKKYHSTLVEGFIKMFTDPEKLKKTG